MSNVSAPGGQKSLIVASKRLHKETMSLWHLDCLWAFYGALVVQGSPWEGASVKEKDWEWQRLEVSYIGITEKKMETIIMGYIGFI